MIIHITSKPEPTLKKKCNVIAYHALCESVAIGETLAGDIRSEGNPADLLTKVVTGHKCKHLMSFILYDIYDGFFSVLVKLFQVTIVTGHRYIF